MNTIRLNRLARAFQTREAAAPRGCRLLLAGVLAWGVWSTTASAAGPRWVSLGGNAGAGPKISVQAADATQVVLTAGVGGYETAVTGRVAGRYARISLPECGYSSTIGEPELPVIRRLLEVPADAQVTVEAEGVTQVTKLAELGLDCPLLPRQRPVPKIPGALKTAPFDYNAAAYQKDTFVPASPVGITEAGYYAGRRLVLLEVSPVAYNPVRGELRMSGRLKVTVRLAGSAKAASLLSNREDAWLAGATLNHPAGGGAKTAGRLLIIAHDSLAPYLDGFVAHKQSLGWTVDLATTLTAGTTTTAIKSYVQARYSDITTRPDALLLVGDTPQIPAFISAQADNPNTDIYYACMDAGDDWQPEFPVGRFCVTSSAQLGAIVNKTIYYETNLPAPWKARAVFMSSTDNYSITEGTHNYVIANYMDSNGYVSDKLYTHTYGATPAQVSAAFNDGRVMGIYSGHGSETYWADGPVFYQSDVNALVNANKYPFVCSFACLTGDYSVSECFAETWQRAANKGAVEMLASSVTSYWDEDDILEKDLFAAIFSDGYREFGPAIQRSKILYLQYWGSTSTTRRYFEMYNLFGDPTVALADLLFAITTASPLPPAYVGEAYSTSFRAGGGTPPYTWAVIDGELPGGMTLNSTAGTISGTPTNSSVATFTLQVTDSTSATTNKLFTLPVQTRLQVVTASNLPMAALNVPYSTTLQAQGGTSPYVWSPAPGGTYLESSPSPGWLGGGTAKGWRADDQTWSLTLPWPFPYYGVNRTSVWVCSNGYLDFGSSDAEYSNSDSGLISKARIAPLWDDLTTDDYVGDDIYVTSNASYVAIRWAAHTYSGGYPVNVEAVLYRDGTIKFNYGAAHSGISPTIGLAMGDGTHYTLSSRDNAYSIPANVSSLFTRTGLLPPGLTLSSSGVISGVATQAGTFSFKAHVEDSGSPAQTNEPPFRLIVTTAPRIANVWWAAGTGCWINFSSLTGRLYGVERLGDVCSSSNSWLVLTDNIPGTGGIITVSDPDACSRVSQFYRLRQW